MLVQRVLRDAQFIGQVVSQNAVVDISQDFPFPVRKPVDSNHVSRQDIQIFTYNPVWKRVEKLPVQPLLQDTQYFQIPVGKIALSFLPIQINARIFDGDTVYIRSQPQVENGQIAAVRIGEEATLKKVYYTPGSDRITLRACNPMYADMVYEGDTLNKIQILGLAVGFYSIVRHEQ